MYKINKMKKLKLFTIAIIITVTVISCGSSKNNKRNRGDIAKFKQECLGAISENAYDRMTEISTRMDETAMSFMVKNGEVFVLPILGDSYYIDEQKFGKIRIKGVKKNGDTYYVWVASEFIK